MTLSSDFNSSNRMCKVVPRNFSIRSRNSIVERVKLRMKIFLKSFLNRKISSWEFLRRQFSHWIRCGRILRKRLRNFSRRCLKNSNQKQQTTTSDSWASNSISTDFTSKSVSKDNPKEKNLKNSTSWNLIIFCSKCQKVDKIWWKLRVRIRRKSNRKLRTVKDCKWSR